MKRVVPSSISSLPTGNPGNYKEYTRPSYIKHLLSVLITIVSEFPETINSTDNSSYSYIRFIGIQKAKKILEFINIDDFLVKCTVYPHTVGCIQVGNLTMELSTIFFGRLKQDFSGQRTDLIEWIAMIFHIDDFEIKPYVVYSKSSTFTSGIMYQISETELTDYLPQRTAHPGMATMVPDCYQIALSIWRLCGNNWI